MAEPWGETKVIKIILDALNEGLIDLQDIKNLIKISYHYGVIDGLAIKDSEDVEGGLKDGRTTTRTQEST